MLIMTTMVGAAIVMAAILGVKLPTPLAIVVKMIAAMVGAAMVMAALVLIGVATIFRKTMVVN